MKKILLIAAMALSLIGSDSALAQPNSAGAVRAACGADIRSLCAGIQPGGGRIIQCMREKRDQLSAGCKDALTAVRRQRQR
jgi:Cysteine rich repeat